MQTVSIFRLRSVRPGLDASEYFPRLAVPNRVPTFSAPLPQAIAGVAAVVATLRPVGHY